jgi:Na+-translocating ferredoxin:NAD+ oxidoreductase RnfG subunit
MTNRKQSQGYVLLLGVIVFSSVALAITISLLQSGTISLQNSILQKQSAIAYVMSEACAEEALQQIRVTPTYTGTITLTEGDASCTATTISTGSYYLDIQSVGTMGSSTRNLFVGISSLSSTISIEVWNEVAGF